MSFEISEISQRSKRQSIPARISRTLSFQTKSTNKKGVAVATKEIKEDIVVAPDTVPNGGSGRHQYSLRRASTLLKSRKAAKEKKTDLEENPILIKLKDLLIAEVRQEIRDGLDTFRQELKEGLHSGPEYKGEEKKQENNRGKQIKADHLYETPTKTASGPLVDGRETPDTGSNKRFTSTKGETITPLKKVKDIGAPASNKNKKKSGLQGSPKSSPAKETTPHDQEKEYWKLLRHEGVLRIPSNKPSKYNPSASELSLDREIAVPKNVTKKIQEFSKHLQKEHRGTKKIDLPGEVESEKIRKLREVESGLRSVRKTNLKGKELEIELERIGFKKMVRPEDLWQEHYFGEGTGLFGEGKGLFEESTELLGDAPGLVRSIFWRDNTFSPFGKAVKGGSADPKHHSHNFAIAAQSELWKGLLPRRLTTNTYIPDGLIGFHPTTQVQQCKHIDHLLYPSNSVELCMPFLICELKCDEPDKGKNTKNKRVARNQTVKGMIHMCESYYHIERKAEFVPGTYPETHSIPAIGIRLVGPHAKLWLMQRYTRYTSKKIAKAFYAMHTVWKGDISEADNMREFLNMLHNIRDHMQGQYTDYFKKRIKEIQQRKRHQDNQFFRSIRDKVQKRSPGKDENPDTEESRPITPPNTSWGRTKSKASSTYRTGSSVYDKSIQDSPTVSRVMRKKHEVSQTEVKTEAESDSAREESDPDEPDNCSPDEGYSDGDQPGSEDSDADYLDSCQPDRNEDDSGDESESDDSENDALHTPPINKAPKPRSSRRDRTS